MTAAQPEFDTAIVGGGLGGLAAGAALARAGCRVVLAERNEEVGGNASVVRRGGFTLERALHQLYGVGRPGSANAVLLDDLGIADRVSFVSLPELTRAAFPGLAFTFPADPGEPEPSLVERFPAERRGIRALMAHGRLLDDLQLFLRPDGLRRALRTLGAAGAARTVFAGAPLVRLRDRTFAAYCRGVTADPALRAVLGAPWVYLGLPPSEVAALPMILTLGAYATEGVFYPRGGSAAIAGALAAVIRGHGGEVRTGADVTRIVTDDRGRAAGIAIAGGGEIRAGAVVSNADARATFGRLLAGGREAAAQARRLDSLVPSISVFRVLIGAAGLAAPAAYETIRFASLDHDEVWARIARGEIGMLAVCVNSLADPALAPAGCHAITLTALAAFRDAAWWGGRRASFTDEMIERAEEILPGLKAAVREIEVIDPPALAARTGVSEGAMYGWANRPDQLFDRRLPQKTPVPGLFLAGQWTAPGAGMTSVMHSGLRAARLAAAYLRGTRRQ